MGQQRLLLWYRLDSLQLTQNLSLTVATGYLGMEFVTGRALQLFPIGKYLGVCTIIWGIVSICSAAVDNYGGSVCPRDASSMCVTSIGPCHFSGNCPLIFISHLEGKVFQTRSQGYN